MREVAEGAVASDVEIFTGKHGGDRQRTAAEALSEDKHVGHDAILLAGEERAGSSQAVRNLVEDEERAVPAADFAEPLPVALGRDGAGAAHGFGDDRGNVAFAAHD